MTVDSRLPTKADEKFGRAICARCGEPAFRIWGAHYGLCAVHNDEYIASVEKLAKTDNTDLDVVVSEDAG